MPGKPEAWDKKASSYDAIASRIKSSGADAVFLGGIICNNGGKLIKDLRAGLGPDVQLFGPDGLTPIYDATIKRPGPARRACGSRSPGIPTDQLKGAGKTFVDDFTRRRARPRPVHGLCGAGRRGAPDAIDDADGERDQVAAKLFNQDFTDGILGTFKIDENGDTTLGTVSVWQIKDGKGDVREDDHPGAQLREGLSRART